MNTFLPEYIDICTVLPPLDQARDQFMAAYLRTALMRNQGHMQRAAAEVGVHRNTFMRHCRAVGIEKGFGHPLKRKRSPNPTDAAARRLIGLKPLPPRSEHAPRPVRLTRGQQRFADVDRMFALMRRQA